MKTLKFFAIVVLSAVVVGVVGYAIADTLEQFAAIFFFGGMFIALIMGAFSERESARFNSIRHYDGRKNYGQAAVFIGTACLFMGSLQECEEVCDDLWHYAQQAEIKVLTGTEADFEIL